MSRRIEDLEPATAALCQAHLSACAAVGLDVFLVHTLRTPEEQARLYAQGRTLPGTIVTNARAGHSWHNFGRAYDLGFRPLGKPNGYTSDGPWMLVAELARPLGLVCGIDFPAGNVKDQDHFEFHSCTTLAQLRAEKGLA